MPNQNPCGVQADTTPQTVNRITHSSDQTSVSLQVEVEGVRVADLAIDEGSSGQVARSITRDIGRIRGKESVILARKWTQ